MLMATNCPTMYMRETRIPVTAESPRIPFWL